MKKRYFCTVEFETIEMSVYAKNKVEAKKLLHEKLKNISAIKFLQKNKTDISER